MRLILQEKVEQEIDLLLHYQPIKIMELAHQHQGMIGCSDWLVTQKCKRETILVLTYPTFTKKHQNIGYGFIRGI